MESGSLERVEWVWRREGRRVCFSSEEGFRRDWVLPSDVGLRPREPGGGGEQGVRTDQQCLGTAPRAGVVGMGSGEAQPAAIHHTVPVVSWKRLCRAKSVHSPTNTWSWALGKTNSESGWTGVEWRASPRAVSSSQYWGGTD